MVSGRPAGNNQLEEDTYQSSSVKRSCGQMNSDGYRTPSNSENEGRKARDGLCAAVVVSALSRCGSALAKE